MSGNILKILIVMCLSTTAWAQELSFKTPANTSEKLTLDQLKAIAAPVDVKVYEYQNKTETSYSAIPAKAVLDKTFGHDVWTKYDLIRFVCSDGYKPIIPVSEFLKYKSYFAFAKPDQTPFQIKSDIHQKKTIDLGPFYLIWNNLENKILHQQGPDYWPYQLVGAELIRFADAYPQIIPAKNSSKKVMDGFALFTKNCLSCHKLNGVGGEASGIELNRHVNVTEYFKNEWLIKYIDNPGAIRENSKMPGYSATSGANMNDKERKKHIEAIIAYMKSMKK